MDSNRFGLGFSDKENRSLALIEQAKNDYRTYLQSGRENRAYYNEIYYNTALELSFLCDSFASFRETVGILNTEFDTIRREFEGER